MNEPTNADLMQRLDEMGHRVENIEDLVQRATGMWLLSKWIAGALLAVLTLWGQMHDWWRQ